MPAAPSEGEGGEQGAEQERRVTLSISSENPCFDNFLGVDGWWTLDHHTVDYTRANTKPGIPLNFAHNALDPCKVIGRTIPGTVRVENGKLYADFKVQPPGDPDADRLWAKIESGIVTDTSVRVATTPESEVRKMSDNQYLFEALETNGMFTSGRP